MEAPISEMLSLAAVVFQTQSVRLKEALHRVLYQPDHEAVHDIRVTCRRLNVALLMTESLFRRSVIRDTRKRVKTLLKFLGELRDAEVQCQRAQKLARKRNTPGLHALAGCLESHQEILRLTMLSRIEQGGFETLPRLIEVIPLPTVLRSRQSELNQWTVTQAANRVLLERLFEIEQYGREDHTSFSDVLHALRIAFKRMRYSADFFSSNPTLQIRLHAILTISKEFQEVLGQLHDADVTQQMVQPMLRKRDADYGVLYSGVKEMFLAAHDDAQRLREDFRVLKQSGKLDVLRAEVVGCI